MSMASISQRLEPVARLLGGGRGTSGRRWRAIPESEWLDRGTSLSRAERRRTPSGTRRGRSEAFFVDDDPAEEWDFFDDFE
jgi:hypothetical protein